MRKSRPSVGKDQYVQAWMWCEVTPTAINLNESNWAFSFAAFLKRRLVHHVFVELSTRTVIELMLQLHKARKSVGQLFCQQMRWTSYWSVVSGVSYMAVHTETARAKRSHSNKKTVQKDISNMPSCGWRWGWATFIHGLASNLAVLRQFSHGNMMFQTFGFMECPASVGGLPLS